MSYYKKTLDIKPNYLDALNNLGLAYRYLSDYEAALSSFQRAMKIDGDYSYAPYNLAVTYFMMGDKENAVKYFKHAGNRFPALRSNVDRYLKQMR